MINEPIIKLLLNAAIIALVFYSIIIHEFSHAFAAFLLGDDSAKRAGRLTLNPLKHIDWFGTVLLPLFLYFTAGFIYGYAKPVPFNPYNFKSFKRDSGLTALAGPASNFLIAIAFALVYHLGGFSVYLQYVATYVIFLNLLLAFFNLIPVPPLDGSKVLGMVLTDTAYYKWTMQEKKGMFYLFAIIIISNLLHLNLIGTIVLPPVRFVMQLLGIG
jgi:Zn-dependent protease